MFFGRKGLILGREENSARIVGKRLCEDARLRAFAAAGGLRPGIHAGYPWTNATARGPFTGLLAGAKHGARASRPPGPERGRLARNDKCGQDARAPQGKRPERRPQIPERGRPARKSRSAGVPPATTNAGKMPALHRGSGLNAVRESGSAGVSPANHEGSEKPRKRGLRFAMGSTPRPGVKRRAEDRLRRGRPVNGPLCSARVEMRRFSNKKDSYSAARSIDPRLLPAPFSACGRGLRNGRQRLIDATGGQRGLRWKIGGPRMRRLMSRRLVAGARCLPPKGLRPSEFIS